MESHSSPKIAYTENSFWRNVRSATGQRPYSNIPHLRGELVTGRLPHLLHDSNSLFETMEEAAKLAAESPYGMCTFYVVNKLIILITKPDDVYKFKTQYQQHVMDPNVDFWHTFPGQAALLDEKYNLKVRSAYRFHASSQTALKDLNPHITAICKEHIHRIEQGGSYCINDTTSYFRKFSIELAARLFMGIKDIKTLDIDSLLDCIASTFPGPNFLGLYLLGLKDPPIDVSNPGLQEIQQFKQELKNKFQKILMPHQEVIKNSNHLLNSIWKLFSEMQNCGEYSSFDDLFPDAFFFLAGGAVVTLADSFPVIFKLISMHPEVEKNLMAELDKNSEKTENVDNLPYLDMIIKEAYRLKSPVPIIPARKVEKNFEFNGINIQKGDCILISPHVCHLSPVIWKNPDKFDPERFTQENFKNIPNGAYIPFGLGHRGCVGNSYGTKALKIFIAQLYSKFKLELENPQTQLEVAGPTMVTHNLKIKLTPRNKLCEDLSEHQFGIKPGR